MSYDAISCHALNVTRNDYIVEDVLSAVRPASNWLLVAGWTQLTRWELSKAQRAPMNSTVAAQPCSVLAFRRNIARSINAQRVNNSILSTLEPKLTVC